MVDADGVSRRFVELTIGRETGGRQYQLLREALGRLQSTTIVTNIRVKRGKKQRQFSWIEGWTDLVDDDGKQSRGMTLTLSDWFYEGRLMDGSLLAIDPVYFSITGGRERWLYRVARKHAAVHKKPLRSAEARPILIT